jgi:hypothetical protein
MITTIDELHHHLYVAMQLEHATIPPYLLALYSIRPKSLTPVETGGPSNLDAYQVLRVVVVEEMLHLTLAANILNAVGGKPDLTGSGFVPKYPAFLPDGETDFMVDLQSFSRAAIKTFLKIERPAKAPSPDKILIPRERYTFVPFPRQPQMHYYSIGEFYEAIREGLNYLNDHLGPDKLFAGAHQSPEKQVGSKYYYSGGAALSEVTDLKSALEAARVIIEQGEGLGWDIYNDKGEIAHYYRFQELLLEQHYEKGDKPGNPTGPEFALDWNGVYPIKKNAQLSDYEQFPELKAAGVAFLQAYAHFLKLLTDAYNGQPQLLLEKAVPEMFNIRNKVNQLIRNPIPGMVGQNAAPTFEMGYLGAAVAA